MYIPDDGLFRIDAEARRAWLGDKELRLTTKEFDLLRVLAGIAGRVVTREQIMREVWGVTWWGSTKTLDMHISWVRRKLGDDPAKPRYLTTVRGVGFRFEVEMVGELPRPHAAREVKDYRLPLRIDRHGQMIWDANDVLVAAAMSPDAARWLVEHANAELEFAGEVAGHG